MASTAGENQRTPRVFISYSHDSAEHCHHVLELATRLRADGLNAQLDQFENSPPQGWPLWCARQILDSNYVLIICTALYRDRFLGLEGFGKGRGVKWEAKVIQNILYYDEVNSGFIPVIFDSSDEEQIPETVKDASWYLILQNGQDSSGYTQLRQRLAGSKTFSPLPTPLPSEAYRQRDDASVPTEEVWDSSRRIEEKLDNLRRLQKRQHRTVMASFAALALLLIAGIIWFKSSTEKIVTDPEILRALAIDEKTYGPEHPNVATDLANFAALLQATNRLEEAEPLMRRALAIDEKSYGPEHPDVAIRLYNLSLLLQATNRLEEAEPMMRRAVLIFVKFTLSTGHLHPYLKDAFGNYGRILKAMSLGEEEIARRIAEVGKEAGLDEQSYHALVAELSK